MNIIQVLSQLDHADRHVRNEAFDRIAASQDPELLKPLSERVKTHLPFIETLFCRYLENLPPQIALPSLKTIFKSPNAASRAHAIATLETFPTTLRLEVYLQLLEESEADMVLHGITQLGIHRRIKAIPGIVTHLQASDKTVQEAAFNALEKIDSPRSHRPLLACLNAESTQQILALNTLGRMISFRHWKRLLPLLHSPNTGVRLAAIRALSQKAGEKIYPNFETLINSEKDEEVIKLMINRMAIAPNESATGILITLAATHPNPQIRRSAGWVIEEIKEDRLQKMMLNVLPKSDEKVQAYIVVKMGHRQLPQCGNAIVNILRKTESSRLRTAALEGLGFLGDKRYLSDVMPYLDNDDPMIAYVATLTTVQLIDLLDDAPTLKTLLLLPGDNKVVLKQVVLQYMIDAISWNFSDPALVAVLRNNLNSPNTNIKYLSIILMGRSKNVAFIPTLIDLLLGDEDVHEMRTVALESLNEAMAGDMQYFLEAIEKSRDNPAKQLALLKLIMDLNLNRESANLALSHLDTMSFDDHKDELWKILDQIAHTVYSTSAEATRHFFNTNTKRTPWRLALGKAWLSSLDIGTAEGRHDWHTLFSEPSPILMRNAAQLAATHEARWAVPILLDKIAKLDEPDLVGELRHATKTILKF